MRKLFAILCATALLGTSAFAGQWTSEQQTTFANMLYDAGKSEGEWDAHLNDYGLKLMTDCIASYYSERITFELALEYYDTMPPDVQKEFQGVLTQCHIFAKEQENNFT